MADLHHLRILGIESTGPDLRRKTQISTWNSWRKRNSDISPNLINADLGELNFDGVFFQRANLSGAIFRGANLDNGHLDSAILISAKFERASMRNCVFLGADLKNANFSKSYLGGADLRNADLEGANFSEANLYSAKLNGSNFSKTNLERANLKEADLRGVNLENAIGLTEYQIKSALIDSTTTLPPFGKKKLDIKGENATYNISRDQKTAENKKKNILGTDVYRRPNLSAHEISNEVSKVISSLDCLARTLELPGGNRSDEDILESDDPVHDAIKRLVEIKTELRILKKKYDVIASHDGDSDDDIRDADMKAKGILEMLKDFIIEMANIKKPSFIDAAAISGISVAFCTISVIFGFNPAIAFGAAVGVTKGGKMWDKLAEKFPWSN